MEVSPAFRLAAHLQVLYALYVAAWHLALPVVFLYFWLRGKREPLYRQYWNERLGRFSGAPDRPVWIHCASLGELRGVMPLIDRLSHEGRAILITTLTPAGRTAAQSRYQPQILERKLAVCYLPLELPWAVRSFVRRVKPLCMLSTEIDTWPVLLRVLQGMKVPCAFVNAGYPEKSFMADQRGLRFRAAFFPAYDLVLCKSALHAERFIQVGCPRVHVAGEMRFDLDIAPHLLQAADSVRRTLKRASDRPVYGLASIVEGEDEPIIAAIQEFLQQTRQEQGPRPLWVYVPRSAQRFEAVLEQIRSAGLRVIRRSDCLTPDLQLQIPETDLSEADVLLGDSFGEMHFYLQLADHVTVGGSFSPMGSHNIIEPLALRKPVTVGPVIWTIEYPAREALALRVLRQVEGPQDLPQVWRQFAQDIDPQLLSKIDAFVLDHSHSVHRHWKHIHEWLYKHG